MWDNHRLLGALANFLLGAAGLMLLYSGLFWVLHTPAFPVRNINIQGQMKKVTPVQLRYVAEHELTGTFFLLDINKTRAAFEKLPWVKEAQVRRRWPDQLDISVVEHEALARWGDAGLISTDGKWFDAASDRPLPVFYGPEGSEKDMAEALGRVEQILAPAGLRPVKLWLSERRAWQVELDNGVKLELGRDRMEERLRRFAAHWGSALAALPYRIEYVDLRYPNGFAVRMPDYKAPPAVKK